jgi:hypothetical protein
VRLYSKRFTNQDRLCHDIANELTKDVHPRAQPYISRRNTSACRPVECENSVPALELWSCVEHITRLHISSDEFRLLIGRHPRSSRVVDLRC